MMFELANVRSSKLRRPFTARTWQELTTTIQAEILGKKADVIRRKAEMLGRKAERYQEGRRRDTRKEGGDIGRKAER